jgi:hypothetical protein
VLPAIQSSAENTNALTYPIFQLQNACYEQFVKVDSNRRKYSHGGQETFLLGFTHSPYDDCSIGENENLGLGWNSVKFANLLAI